MTTSWRMGIRLTSCTMLAVTRLGLLLLVGAGASDGTYERLSPASSPSRSGTIPSPSTPSPSPTSPSPAPRGGTGRGH